MFHLWCLSFTLLQSLDYIGFQDQAPLTENSFEINILECARVSEVPKLVWTQFNFCKSEQQLKLEQQRLHDGLSPEQGLQLLAKTQQLGPRTGLRWGRWKHHQSHRRYHRWRRGYHQPRWLVSLVLAEKALLPPPPSTPVGRHWRRRPPGCQNFQ